VPRLWDTDVLSFHWERKNTHVVRRAKAYLTQHPHILFSLITRYEILRGLKAKRATAKLASFEAFCLQHHVLPLGRAIADLASDLWAQLSQKGQVIGDNDVFIAATALHHGLVLATGNIAHFSRISGLSVEDWTQP
jgi:tRNA(fMet)-specific endonuclease VapC